MKKKPAANNPSLHVYTTTLDFIMSNETIAAAIKPVNITRYDDPKRVNQLWKPSLAPADLPDFIFQQIGFAKNRHSSHEHVEQYDFQAVITTSEWKISHAYIPHAMIDWIYTANQTGRMHKLDWGQYRRFYKTEVLPMQIANYRPENRNLQGFVYAFTFNVQLSAFIGEQ